MSEETKKKIIFRADGNTTVGWGHVMRLLSLAAILKHDFDCVFAIQQPEPFLEKEILLHCSQVITLPLTSYLIPEKANKKNELSFDLGGILTGQEIVVVDGYFFGETYQKAIKTLGCKLVFIDDLVNMYMYADVVINQTPGISPESYRKENYTKIFIGQKYVLLRPPFIEASGKQLHKNGRELSNIVVGFGGSDSYDLNIKFAKFLIERPLVAENIHFILPPEYKRAKEIEELMSNSSGIKINTYSKLSSNEVLNLMDIADAGVCSASVMAYEALASGLPLMCGWYAENQRQFYNFMNDNKLITGLGNLIELDKNNFIKSAGYSRIDFQALANFRKNIFDSNSNLKTIFLSLN